MEGFDFDYSHSKLSEEKEGITNQAIFCVGSFLGGVEGGVSL